MKKSAIGVEFQTHERVKRNVNMSIQDVHIFRGKPLFCATKQDVTVKKDKTSVFS